MSWHVIAPFLRPIEHFLHDPEISDILINDSAVFIERHGELQPAPNVVVSEKLLDVAIRNIARVLGDEVNEGKPILDARLPDGSRVTAVIPPCSVNGITLAIRKFNSRRYSPDELVRIGTLSLGLLNELRRAVEERWNILISGGTGTGKTTLLNALSSFIPDSERIVVIEDTSELQLQARHQVRLEARRAQPELPAVTIRELLRATLRLRPDRILLGEVRDGEAFDLLQALNTGHTGTLSTIHATTAERTLPRFTSCVLQSGIDLPYAAIRSSMAEALNLIVHVERRRGIRYVSEALVVDRYVPTEDRFYFSPLFKKG